LIETKHPPGEHMELAIQRVALFAEHYQPVGSDGIQIKDFVTRKWLLTCDHPAAPEVSLQLAVIHLE